MSQTSPAPTIASQVISAETLQAAQQRPHGAYTDGLARYAAEFSYDRVPADVRDFARGIVLDTLGAMLAASSGRYGLRGTLGSFVSQQRRHARGDAGRARRESSLVNAALYNGTLGYYCDIEAHHPGAILHGPAIVVPAALAVAEARGASGQDVLAAVVLGVDVACRVSYAIDPNALYARAFHPTAVCGAFGAAAAVGRISGSTARGWPTPSGWPPTRPPACWPGPATTPSSLARSTRVWPPATGPPPPCWPRPAWARPQHILDPAEKYNVFRAWSVQPRPEELLDRLYERFFLMELGGQAVRLLRLPAPGPGRRAGAAGGGRRHRRGRQRRSPCASATPAAR